MNAEIKYAQESFADMEIELKTLTVRHWEEIAHNKELIKLDPDWEMYRILGAKGVIHFTSARKDGELVGYQVYSVMPHMHYKSSLTASSDVLYLAPEYRKGRTGIRLMQAAEKNLKALGVQRVLQNVKLSNDWGAILEMLGFTPFERIYSKLL